MNKYKIKADDDYLIKEIEKLLLNPDKTEVGELFTVITDGSILPAEELYQLLQYKKLYHLKNRLIKNFIENTYTGIEHFPLIEKFFNNIQNEDIEKARNKFENACRNIVQRNIDWWSAHNSDIVNKADMEDSVIRYFHKDLNEAKLEKCMEIINNLEIPNTIYEIKYTEMFKDAVNKEVEKRLEEILWK